MNGFLATVRKREEYRLRYRSTSTATPANPLTAVVSVSPGVSTGLCNVVAEEYDEERYGDNVGTLDHCRPVKVPEKFTTDFM